jgi:two-component system sensor histidine kinase KdpD
MLLRKVDRTNQFLISLTSIGLITALFFSFSDFIPYRVVALVLLLCLSVLAMLFEFAPVITAAVFSALLWDYFFIPPRFTLTIGEAEDTLMLIMYFIIALVNASLTYILRGIERRVILEEGRANTIKLYNTILNSLSHELRTPISAIISATDYLLLHPKKIEIETQTELVKEISSASLRLNYQVENLLNMSRLESGTINLNCNWCDVSDLIRSAVNKLESELRDHKVVINIPDKFPLCKIDFGLLEQALFNLILNAALYTAKGSVISISVLDAKIINDKDSIDILSDILVIHVSDNGQGFPPDEVSKVFDKFYRLKHSRSGGTGLGLSITRGFIEAHQGKIKLENKAKGGAIFTISIPCEMSFITNLKNE